MPDKPNLCVECGSETKWEGRCSACIAADYDDYEDNGDCWNCGGDGWVSHCFEAFACLHPDEGCDLCLKRCDVCNPRKLTPEEEVQKTALREVMAAALKEVNSHDRT